MVFEGTFLSIFINKKKLLLTGCITNQFYLEKSKPNRSQGFKLYAFTRANKYITIYEK